MLTLTFAAVTALAAQSASAATVFAHFMVQNTYAYDVAQWQTDISAAQAIGIDGFALNWVPPDCDAQSPLDWQVDRIDDAFTAASGMGFSLIHSFDMSYTTCNIYWNQTFMQSMISKYASSSATYRWNNNILVSTYGGDTVGEYGDSFFSSLKSGSPDPITLAPALTTFSDQAQSDASGAASSVFQQYPSIDGFLNWQAWPLDVPGNLSLAPDQAFQSALKSAGRSGPYIMAISPWQFKDLNDGSTNDAWVQYSDTLFSDRFTSLVSGQISPDIIELLTWNDFPESHYLRDLPDQSDPSATDAVQLGDTGNYVWGQEHSAWRIMAQYYISWWKNGSPPTPSEDQVVYWYRVHPKASSCSSGTPVRNSDFPEDAVFAWALVREASTVSLSLGSNQGYTFQADGSGPVVGSVPFPSDLSGSGEYPQFSISSSSGVTASGQGALPVAEDCSWYDFNPVVGVVSSGS